MVFHRSWTVGLLFAASTISMLTAFVGLTTSIFSRPYMRVERDHGKMTPPRLRLYHSMYQLFNFTMLLALLTNNLGILWVAMEAATLTTVLLVSVYRTAASLEAAWKYFILCGVGIAPISREFAACGKMALVVVALAGCSRDREWECDEPADLKPEMTTRPHDMTTADSQ